MIKRSILYVLVVAILLSFLPGVVQRHDAQAFPELTCQGDCSFSASDADGKSIIEISQTRLDHQPHAIDSSSGHAAKRSGDGEYFYTVEPSSWSWLHWPQSARGPPSDPLDQLALFTTPWLGATGTTPPVPDFFAPLQTTLVPSWSAGSATPTFTRATTAYQIDFEGKHNLALSGEARMQGARRVENLVSSDMSTWTVAADATRTTGIADPAGDTNAITLTATNAAADSRIYVTPASATGRSSRYTFYVRRRTGTGVVEFSNTAGTLLAITGNISSSWVRVTSAVALRNGAAISIFLRTTGDAIDLYLPMVEDVTGQANQNPSEAVSNGFLSAPFHGAGVDGVKYFDTLNGNTVASNVVTEATGALITSAEAECANGVALSVVDADGPTGYLSEGARADVLGATAAIRRTMTDAGWVVGATMTVGTAVGTDGVTDAAASLTGGAVTATNTILFTTVLGSAAYTYSGLVRRKTGTGTIEMTDNGGANWTDITSTLTTTYKLFQVTRTQANPVVGFRITTNADAIEVDFNTLEPAAFANPTPIPVNVSKAGDVLTYVTAGNIQNSAGTIYAEITTSGIDGSYAPIGDTFSGGGGVPLFIETTNKLSLYDVTTTRESGPSVSRPLLTSTKVGINWGGATTIGAVNGTLGTEQVFDGSLNTSAVLGIGVRPDLSASTNQLFGTIRNVRIWLAAMSSTQAAMQTADSSWLMPYRVAWVNPQEAANDDQYRIVANGR